MRQALPLWHCLDNKSKLALLDTLREMGETEFNAPKPVWKEFLPIEIEHIIDDYDRLKWIDKMMRVPTRPSPESRK